MSKTRVVSQIMRDGIFKTAPLTKKWHQVGKCAEREADHGERLADALTKALLDDIKKDVLKGLQTVAALVVSDRLLILKGDELREFFQRMEPQSRFAKDVISDIKFVCRGGRSFDAQALIDAVASSSKRHVDAIRAEMLGHAHKQTDATHFTAIARGLNEAVNNLDYVAVARGALLNDKIDAPRNHPFDFDENLLD